jgi:hypothetical protein
MEVRRVLLALLDVVERRCEVSPRNKEIRDWYRARV